MLVHSLWDQEDIYGAPAVYKALEPKDTANDKVFLVHRPVAPRPGDRATAARSARSSSTATPRCTSASKILRPFLDQYLKDGAPTADVAPVTAFETGTNTWRSSPPGRSGCASRLRRQADAALPARRAEAGFERAGSRRRGVRRVRLRSGQAGAVPRAGPSSRWATTTGYTWPHWLVDDQREASGRTDVLTFVSDVADGAAARSAASRS